MYKLPKPGSGKGHEGGFSVGQYGGDDAAKVLGVMSGPYGAAAVAANEAYRNKKNKSSGGGGDPAGAGLNSQPITNVGQLKDHMANGGSLEMGGLIGAMPNYSSIMEKGADGQMGIASPYKVDFSGSDGYSTMKSQAMGPGPTDGYYSTAGLINTNTANAANAASVDNQNMYLSNVSAMGQGGGVDAGSRERLLRSRGVADANAKASIYGTGAASMGSAAIADQNYKQNLLGTITQADIQAEMANKGNAIADARGGNMYGLEQWNKLGDIYGSDQMAKATEAAANREDPGMLGMGGFLGTGMGGNKGLGGSGFGSKEWDNRTIRRPVSNFGGSTGGR